MSLYVLDACKLLQFPFPLYENTHIKVEAFYLER